MGRVYLHSPIAGALHTIPAGLERVPRLRLGYQCASVLHKPAKLASIQLRVQMNYSTEQLDQFPWVVSAGTLRPDQLAAAYLDAFDALELECPEPFCSDLQQAAAYALDTVGPEPAEARLEALEWAAGVLNDAAPTGFHFGALEADPACLGFWLDQDWVTALEERGLDLELEDPVDVARFVEAATDYGLEPDTLCDGYCGSVSGFTAEEAGACYAQELAEDCGMVPDDAAWPMRHIDWKAAWRELELSDNYGAKPAHGPGMFWIFRSV